MLVQVKDQDADQERYGIKRTCRSCGVSFYDLDKHPSECPNCGAIYELHVNARSRRATPAVENYEENISFLDLDHEDEDISAADNDGKIIEDDNPFETLVDDE